MKKLKKITLLLLLTFVILPTVVSSQQIEDEIKKISLKLKMDETYLNLKYLSTQLDSTVTGKLQNIPRTNHKKPYSFTSSSNVQYRIVFLNKGVGLDSIYLMYIDEIKLNTLSGESFFVDESVKDDTMQVLSFKDLYTLRKKNRKYYDVLLNEVDKFVVENEIEVLPSLLVINPDKRKKSYMGMTSKDNTDFFNFQKISNPHYIPRAKVKSRSVRHSEDLGKDFRIDASFTRLTFSLKSLDYSIGSTGFEVSAVEPILNLLPLESSNLFVGFRSIFRISEEKNIKKASFIDAKLMAKINIRNSDIFRQLPFVMGSNAKLNISNGFGGEFQLTRVFGLPFITLKGYLSNNDFENPKYLFRASDSTKEAYFSNTQVEGTFSFYWNGNTKMTSRFKFDFGVAYFDTWRSIYDGDKKLISSDEEGESHITPVFGLSYIFVPSEIPLLGVDLRVFDSRITIGGWIKVFEFAPENVLRFEAKSITEPFTRPLSTWESSGGIFFQFRYRYGL